VIKTGFYECEKSGAFLWGIQHLHKKTALKNSISHNLKLISSTFYGCIYTGIDSSLKFSDDIERTILYFQQNSAIVRLNMFGVTSTKTIQLTEKEMRSLEKKYPDYILLVETSKGLKLKLRQDKCKKLESEKKNHS
jgi:hypothetical protein